MRVIALFVAACLGTSFGAAGHETYQVTEVGYSAAGHSYAINRSGVVVGTSFTIDGDRAFRFADGLFEWLPTRGGITYGFAVNDRGDAAGGCLMARLQWMHACLWTGGRAKDLGTVAGDLGSLALGINRWREVTGTSGDRPHAFVYRHGIMTRLDDHGAILSFGTAINVHGHVGGWLQRADGTSRGFIHDGVELHELGLLPGGNGSAAAALNDADDLAGSANVDSFRYHAALFTAGNVIDLGTLGGEYSAATAINNRGEIVGWAETRFAFRAAFIWRKGRMVRLSRQLEPVTGEGWVLHAATGINDKGQIAGYGTHHGEPRVFLLTPVK
jgi:probable HAF family extracellular repeat protein